MRSPILNQELNRLMLEKGIGKRELARLAGVSAPYVVEVTKNNASFTVKAFLKVLMKGFGMEKAEAKKYLLPLVQKKAVEELEQL